MFVTQPISAVIMETVSRCTIAVTMTTTVVTIQMRLNAVSIVIYLF